MENISEHITYAEGVKSQDAVRKGLPNTPNAEQLAAMRHVAENIFERVRTHFGVPIAITSFFRSHAVNASVGGSATSQHCYGEAMDMDADVFGKITNRDIFFYIKDNLDFDQLIWEFGDTDNPAWVHVSLKQGLQRRKILRAVSTQGKTTYEPWRG